MKKYITKKEIAAAEKIIGRLGAGMEIKLESLAACTVKAENDRAESYYRGAIWGTLDTLERVGQLNVTEMFLLDRYYTDKIWELQVKAKAGVA